MGSSMQQCGDRRSPSADYRIDTNAARRLCFEDVGTSTGVLLELEKVADAQCSFASTEFANPDRRLSTSSGAQHVALSYAAGVDGAGVSSVSADDTEVLDRHSTMGIEMLVVCNGSFPLLASIAAAPGCAPPAGNRWDRAA